MSATTLQTLANGVLELARAAGTTDADIKNSILQIRSDMSDVTASVAATRRILNTLPTDISAANSKISTASTKVSDVSTAVSTLNTNAANGIGTINISSNNSVLAGHPITFTVTATSNLTGVNMSTFTASLAGEQTQTVFAVNNSASFVFDVDDNATNGSTLQFSVTVQDDVGNTKTATKNVSVVVAYVSQPTITSPANASNSVIASGLTITSDAFSVSGGTDTHASSNWKITSDSTGNNIVASALTSSDLTSHIFTSSDLNGINAGTYCVWVQYTGVNLGDSSWSNGVQISLTAGEEYNGFLLYRNNNDTATVIEYNWPNADGTLGERRKMEVIDAAYRNTNIAYASSDNYKNNNTNLADFNYSGYDNSSFVYNKNNYDHKTAIPTNIAAFTNSGICSQWRNFSTDKTATYNTQQWMNDSHFNQSGYAPYWVTHLTYDGGGWVIPNAFQLIVIYCCSDKLDEMDPTASANSGMKLGYTATNGRFYANATNYWYWSSTEYGTLAVRAVFFSGLCSSASKDYTAGVVPIRELAVAA